MIKKCGEVGNRVMNDIIINSIILHKITQFQSRIQQQP